MASNMLEMDSEVLDLYDHISLEVNSIKNYLSEKKS